MVNREVIRRVNIRGKNLLYEALYDVITVVGVILAIALLFHIRVVSTYGRAELNGRVRQIEIDRNTLVDYAVLERDPEDETGVTTWPITILVDVPNRNDYANYGMNSERHLKGTRWTGRLFARLYYDTGWNVDIVYQLSQTWLALIVLGAVVLAARKILRQKIYAYLSRVQSGEETEKEVEGFRSLCDSRLIKYLLVLAVAINVPFLKVAVVILATLYVISAEALYYFRRFFATRPLDKASQSKFAKLVSWIGWDEFMSHLTVKQQKYMLIVRDVVLGILGLPGRFLMAIYNWIVKDQKSSRKKQRSKRSNDQSDEQSDEQSQDDDFEGFEGFFAGFDDFTDN